MKRSRRSARSPDLRQPALQTIERPDVQPREPWPQPLQVWSFDGPRPQLMNVRQLLEDMVYHLPPWQRGQVWTPDQQVALCEAMWAGLPIQPMLLWERRRPDGTRYVVVLDGQQRLTAMGATVYRHNGTRNTPTAAHLDLETGRWQVGPVDGHPPITMREAATTSWLWLRRAMMTDEEHWRTAMLCARASQRLQSSVFVYSMGPSVGVEDAIRIFRSWNVPGVPIPPNEVERLIREADLNWAPAVSNGET